jgi:hypothetical protein
MEEMMSISSPAEQDIIDTMKVFIESNINPWSIVWGLPLQHGWQYSSGRLETDANSTSINIKAWWADMNYYLSVIPYFGAYEAGFAPKIVLATHTDDERFCSSPSACRDVIKPWSDFFILLNETKNDCVDDNHQSIENYTPHTPLANSLDFNLSAGKIHYKLTNSFHSLTLESNRRRDPIIQSMGSSFAFNWLCFTII